MGSTAHTDKRHGDLARSVGNLELESGTSLDTLGGKTIDERSVSEGTVLLEEVRRLEDLAVGMVGLLGAASSRSTDLVDVAEATTTNEDSGVGEEDGDRVVVAGNSVGSKLGPLVGSRVVELRNENTVSVGEDHRLALTTSNENSSIRKDNSVTKTTGESHVSDTLDGSRLVSLAESGDVSVLVGIGVGVIGSTTSGKNLAVDSIVHDKDTAHGVDVVSGTGQTDGTLLLGAVPVLGLGRTGLEDTALLPAEQPSVVILAPDTLVILGEHGLDVGAGEKGPLVGLGVVDLTGLTLTATRVGTTDSEDAAVREDGGGLVTTGHLQIGTAGERVVAGVVEGDSLGIRATLNDDTAVTKLAHTRAEHVVVSISNLTTGNVSGGKVHGTELGATRSTTESIGAPRRKEEKFLRLRKLRNDVGSDGNERKTDDVGPSAESSRLDCGGELNDAVSLALNPEKGIGRLSSLDVADPVLVIVDSLLASGNVGALISASSKRSNILDLSGRSTNKVGLMADVKSLTLALARLVLMATSGANRDKLALINILEDNSVKVLVSLPVHAISVSLILDVADTTLLVVDGLDTARILVADLGAGVGVTDILDNLKRASSVLVVGVAADGVVDAGLGGPGGFLGGTLGESGGGEGRKYKGS